MCVYVYIYNTVRCMCCSVLQYNAGCCSVLQGVTLHCTAYCMLLVSSSQCVAVSCSVNVYKCVCSVVYMVAVCGGDGSMNM